MSTFLISILVVMVLVLVLMIRNELTCRWIHMAIADASFEARKAFERGEKDAMRFYKQIPSYSSVLFDLTYWRYRSPFQEKP